MFFIPFDGEGIIALGEFSSEAYILFLLIFLGLYTLKFFFKPISIPFKSTEFQLLILFIIVLIISSLINLPYIYHSKVGPKTGFYKLATQFLVLLFFVFPVLIFFYNLFLEHQHKLIFSIRKVFVVTLYVVFAVGFLEVLYIFYRVPGTKDILNIVDEIPLIKLNLTPWDKRISSITREPPSLGMFLITILPWLLVYKPKRNKIWLYFLPLVFILFLSFYSGSRSGIFIIFLQLIAYFILVNTNKISITKFKRLLQVSVIVILIIPVGLFKLKDSEVIQDKIQSFSFVENYKQNTSNKTRLGTYVASLETIKNQPTLGVGYGQAGFYILDDYPFWSYNDNREIERYRSGERFPPMFNIYLRVLVESGFIGFFVFILFITFLFYKSMLQYYNGNLQFKKDNLIIILSLIGYSLTWMQFDTFRVLGFWVFLSFYLYIQNRIKNEYY